MNTPTSLSRWSKGIVGLWICVLGLALGKLLWVPSPMVETELSGATGTEAWQVSEVLKKEFGFKLGSSLALVSHQPILAPQLRALESHFSDIKNIERLQGKNEHRLFLYQIHMQPDTHINRIHDLTEKIRDWLKSSPVKNVWVTGNAAFQHDAKSAGKKESRQVESVALGLSFLILVFNFGSVSAALLPILVGASTLVFLNAWMQVLGLPLNPVARILSTLVGLALAIDYSLFMVARYREELDKHPVAKALKHTLRSAGETILFSALIMALSIAVLLIPDVSLSRTVMGSLLWVIGFSLLHALVVLPAILVLSGRWLSFPKRLNHWVKSLNTAGFWLGFSQHVVRHARGYFALSLVLLLGLSAPVVGMKLWDPVQAVAPRDSESLKAYQALQSDGWGGELIPIVLVHKAPKGQVPFSAQSQQELALFLKAFEGDPAVGEIQSLLSWHPTFTRDEYTNLYQSLGALGMLYQADSPFSKLVSPSQDLSLIYLFPKDLMSLTDTDHLLEKIKAFQTQHPKIEMLRGGTVARVRDFTHELYRHTPWMLLLMLSGIYVLLFVYMRSLVLPLKAAFMNFLPILSAFGILTLIFQHGWGHSLLGTPVNMAVTNIVPLVLFCVIFGLSMDYEVLILSRISEEYHAHKDVTQAVVQGLAHSGGVITGAVLILLGVFVPGAFSSSPQTQEICIGITAAIFLDATVVRLFLVPSFMMLMGKYNWWNPFSRG